MVLWGRGGLRVWRRACRTPGLQVVGSWYNCAVFVASAAEQRPCIALQPLQLLLTATCGWWQ